MRVWYPIPVTELDVPRLKGEHVEGHAIHSINANGKKGYSHHPEVKRWKGFLDALSVRHDQVVAELQRRGIPFRHKSPMPRAEGEVQWPTELVEPLESMQAKLAAKIANSS